MSGRGKWTYGVLGDVTAVRAGRPAVIPASKPKLLLALLVTRPNQVVSADQLIDELWDGTPPASARTLLHGYIADLRGILEPERAPRTPATILRTQSPGYVLACLPEDVDATTFEHLVRRAREAFQRQDAAAARGFLDEALDLWQGDPFGAVRDAPALQPARTRLEQLHLSAVEDRVMLDLRDGQDATLVPELERLVAQHPLRERLWAALLLALYRSGRQADALAAYERIAGVLRDQLGADPGPELSRTHAAILRQEADLPRLGSTSRLNRPPRSTTRLVGRQDLLARLGETVGDHRLVTLLGPGGCGKTRLAQELARSLEPAEPVAWVDLAPTRHAAAVVATTMTALGVVEQPRRDPLDTLVAQLSDRRLVVVLDTCEHQLAACRDLVDALLQGCTGLRVVATSRTALRLHGEVRWTVPPLALPTDGADRGAAATAEAVQLFVDRARDVRPGFTLSSDNHADVVAICRQLEGIPLAIELAASWVAVLGLPAIRDQLSDPLGFLTRGSPQAPPRQQTLRSTIEWSHRLLPDEDRRVLAQLSVFAGAFPLDAAVRVCGVDGTDSTLGTDEVEPDTPGLIDRLANLQAASLVAAVHRPGRRECYHLLDTIRQFGQERLDAAGLSTRLHERHARYVHDLARQAEPALYGPELSTWLAWLEDAHADVRAALAWALDADQPGLALDTAGALARYWMARAHIAEGRRFVRRALDADDGQHPSARVRALLAASFLASLHYDLDVARTTADEALTMVRAVGHVRGTAWALGLAGLAAAMAGDTTASVRSTQEALQLPGIEEDPLARGWALNFLALGLQAGGQYEQQREALAESLELCREAGDPMGIEWALGYGGSAAYALGRREEAVRLLEQSLALSTRIGNSWGMARNLAAVALASRDAAAARAQMRSSLRTFGRLGDRAGVAFCLRAIAGWLVALGTPNDATTLLDVSDEVGTGVDQVPVLGHLASGAVVEGRPRDARRSPGPATWVAPTSIEGAVATGLAALERLETADEPRRERMFRGT